jgi:hypothetical protein
VCSTMRYSQVFDGVCYCDCWSNKSVYKVKLEAYNERHTCTVSTAVATTLDQHTCYTFAGSTHALAVADYDASTSAMKHTRCVRHHTQCVCVCTVLYVIACIPAQLA